MILNGRQATALASQYRRSRSGDGYLNLPWYFNDEYLQQFNNSDQGLRYRNDTSSIIHIITSLRTKLVYNLISTSQIGVFTGPAEGGCAWRPQSNQNNLLWFQPWMEGLCLPDFCNAVRSLQALFGLVSPLNTNAMPTLALLMTDRRSDTGLPRRVPCKVRWTCLGGLFPWCTAFPRRPFWLDWANLKVT